MNIGIIGYGIVGKSVAVSFQSKCHLYVYDPDYINTSTTEENIKFCKTINPIIENSAFIFICVPTPMKDDSVHSFDSSYMDATLDALAQALPPGQEHILIIKSTVVPSKVNEYIKHYSQLNIVISPEFLTEKNYITCALKPAYQIYGGQDIHTHKVQQLFEKHSICSPCKVAYCDPVGASLIKYMVNSFLAMKVGFMNQFYDVAKLSGTQMQWQEITEIFHHDTRVGNSHADVPGDDGQRGWGGKCFPKDVRAIIDDAKSHRYALDIMQTVWEYNRKLRDDH